MKIRNLFYQYISSSSNTSKMLAFITILIFNACIAGTIPATPENITVTFLTPTTVRVSWQTAIDLNAHPVEKYIVTYKPTDDRVVQDVAGNSDAIVLDRLSPSTQYSIAVTAIWLGKKYRSRSIFFKTLDMPKPLSQHDIMSGAGLFASGNAAVNAASGAAGVSVSGSSSSVPTLADRGATNGSGGLSGGGVAGIGDDVTATTTNILPHGTHRELPTIRGVEIGIVLIVLMVWAGAIALFFNRWGKIRMLLPYQPDYKHEQLKVPGTGVCSGGVCNGQHSHQNLHPDMFVKFDSSECGALAYQPLHCSSRHFHMLQEERSASISERCTRSRINSAIFVSSEGRGFDSIEFLRRHGSQSVLCRKYRSAENITDNERKKSFSDKRQWRTDEGDESTANDTDGKNDAAGDGIELHERRRTSTFSVMRAELPRQAMATATSALGHSAAVTTANIIVGSISIEAPPAYMKDDISVDLERKHQSLATTNSVSRDSNDTVEELILVPTEYKSRALVHQRSSTASSTNRSQSPAPSSTHSSPKAFGFKGHGLAGCKPKPLNVLPMVSVSEPSPPHEKPPPGECL